MLFSNSFWHVGISLKDAPLELLSWGNSSEFEKKFPFLFSSPTANIISGRMAQANQPEVSEQKKGMFIQSSGLEWEREWMGIPLNESYYLSCFLSLSAPHLRKVGRAVLPSTVGAGPHQRGGVHGQRFTAATRGVWLKV